MAYTAMSDVSTNDTVTAAYMNTYWQDNIEYVHSELPRARVYHNTTQSIANTGAYVVCNSERYDVGVCHDVVSNTSRLTVPAGEQGDYGIAFNGEWATTPATYAVSIIVNRTTTIAKQTFTQKEFSISTEYRLAAADYVEVYILPATTQTLNSTSAYSPEFMFSKINAY